MPVIVVNPATIRLWKQNMKNFFINLFKFTEITYITIAVSCMGAAVLYMITIKATDWSASSTLGWFYLGGSIINCVIILVMMGEAHPTNLKPIKLATIISIVLSIIIWKSAENEVTTLEQTKIYNQEVKEKKKAEIEQQNLRNKADDEQRAIRNKKEAEEQAIKQKKIDEKCLIILNTFVNLSKEDRVVLWKDHRYTTNYDDNVELYFETLKKIKPEERLIAFSQAVDYIKSVCKFPD